MGRGKTSVCKINRLSIMAISLLMLLALALGSYADVLTCSVITPASDGTISKLSKINASLAGGTGNATLTLNVTAYSSTTANSTVAVVLTSLTNLTGATLMSNGSINTSLSDDIDGIVIEDSKDYTVNISIFSNTDSATCGKLTNVVIDRTKPSTPTNPRPTGNNESTTMVYSANVIAINTSLCTLHFIGSNPGSSQYAMTHSGSTCSLTLSNMPETQYTYFIRASDGTNTSDTANQVLTLDSNVRSNTQKAAGGYLIATGQAQEEGISEESVVVDGSSVLPPAISNELTPPELAKTGTGAIIGGVIGASGFIGGPLGFITIPVGAFIGGVIGAWL